MNQSTNQSAIQQYFAGQVILITGGTGFMGKVLVEKLLRCCPDLEKIYLLARPKKQKSAEERWKEITELPLFDLLRSTNPDALNKVQMIKGDISEDDLGISKEDLQILTENVTLIYHAAAMIQFTDNLHSVLINNTRATFTLLNIAKNMKKLQLFVHVSTAYSNMNIPCDQAEERVIPACQDWKVMLQLLKTDPNGLTSLKEKIMGGHPNPYTWSKSLSEQIVDDYSKYFPTTIMRPAVVFPVWKDPLQGWVDILSGISAISIPIGLGLMRLAFTNQNCYQDWLPCDIAISAMIVATYTKSIKPNRTETDVYNCGITKEVAVTTRILTNYGKEVVERFPSKNTIWAYHCICTTNEFLFHLLFFLLQVIPAAFMDSLLYLTGKKPMVLKLTKKVAKVFVLFKRFSSAQIEFPNDNFKKLENYLVGKDKADFSMSVEGLTARFVLEYGYYSTLKYLFKEDLSEKTLERNRKRIFWLKVADKVLIYTFYAGMAYLVTRLIPSIDTVRTFSSIFYGAFWN